MKGAFSDMNEFSGNVLMLCAWCKIVIGSGVCLVASGCITPMNTRLPQVGWNDPRIERREQERFDAYPMPDLGPNTYTRQRDAMTVRPQTQRLNDQLLINKYGQSAVGTPSQSPSYRQAVRE